MTNRYKVTNCAKINGTELVNLLKLDANGAGLPGSTLQIHDPKGSGLFTAFDDGDVVAVTIEKVSAAQLADEARQRSAQSSISAADAAKIAADAAKIKAS